MMLNISEAFFCMLHIQTCICSKIRKSKLSLANTGVYTSHKHINYVFKYSKMCNLLTVTDTSKVQQYKEGQIVTCSAVIERI
jgi:hypothetical protein